MRAQRAFRRFLLSAAIVTMGAASAHADTYFGCFKNTTNKVRPSSILVNQTPACKATETLRSWNEQGVQGPQGPAGVVGSCHPEEFPGVAPAGSFGVTNMFCATGHATGAGCIWATPFDGANNGKMYVFPRGDNFWTAVPYNDMGFSADYKCYLQCCS